MNIEDLRDYCLSLKAVEEKMPWTEPQYNMLVTFSVGGKWFCLLDTVKKFIDVKSDPEKIQAILAHYKGAFPAWHMKKEHWIGITLNSDVPDSLIKELLEEGYKSVVHHLPKKTMDIVFGSAKEDV